MRHSVQRWEARAGVRTRYLGSGTNAERELRVVNHHGHRRWNQQVSHPAPARRRLVLHRARRRHRGPVSRATEFSPLTAMRSPRRWPSVLSTARWSGNRAPEDHGVGPQPLLPNPIPDNGTVTFLTPPLSSWRSTQVATLRYVLLRPVRWSYTEGLFDLGRPRGCEARRLEGSGQWPNRPPYAFTG
jgi:hypothetical protein